MSVLCEYYESLISYPSATTLLDLLAPVWTVHIRSIRVLTANHQSAISKLVVALASAFLEDTMKYHYKENIRMLVRFATERKALEASNKHFGGKLSVDQMVQLTARVIKNAEYVGISDRSNGKYEPGKIVWSTIAGIMIAVVLDGRDISKGIATVVSIYDVRNPIHKAIKFGMKAVQ